MKVPTATTSKLWLVARWAGVAVTLALLAGLVLRPGITLDVLWNVLIPLVPISLLITPMLWRNVCPLATLNMVTNRPGVARKLDDRWLSLAGLAGILLLVLLVPARRFLFNTDGVALALTIAAVALLALAFGAVFDMKAGFCNAICPVLPVERLYGQHPLVSLSNPRCVPCTLCTKKGCIDLAPPRSIARTLGGARHSHRWLLSGYGVFAAAFPGFVIGYFTLTDGPLSSAGLVYGHMVVWAGASYLAAALLTVLLRLRAATATVLLGAVAAGLYYWYAATTISTALGLPAGTVLGLRLVTLALVVVWMTGALRHEADALSAT